jgi:hypothetical protein
MRLIRRNQHKIIPIRGLASGSIFLKWQTHKRIDFFNPIGSEVWSEHATPKHQLLPCRFEGKIRRIRFVRETRRRRKVQDVPEQSAFKCGSVIEGVRIIAMTIHDRHLPIGDRLQMPIISPARICKWDDVLSELEIIRLILCKILWAHPLHIIHPEVGRIIHPEMGRVQLLLAEPTAISQCDIRRGPRKLSNRFVFVIARLSSWPKASI